MEYHTKKIYIHYHTASSHKFGKKMQPQKKSKDIRGKKKKKSYLYIIYPISSTTWITMNVINMPVETQLTVGHPPAGPEVNRWLAVPRSRCGKNILC